MILTEKGTWVMGTAMFLAMLIGVGIAINTPKIELTVVGIVIGLVICWLTIVLLVATIKWNDRLREAW